MAASTFRSWDGSCYGKGRRTSSSRALDRTAVGSGQWPVGRNCLLPTAYCLLPTAHCLLLYDMGGGLAGDLVQELLAAFLVDLFQLFEDGFRFLRSAHGTVGHGQPVVRVGLVGIQANGFFQRRNGFFVLLLLCVD